MQAFKRLRKRTKHTVMVSAVSAFIAYFFDPDNGPDRRASAQRKLSELRSKTRCMGKRTPVSEMNGTDRSIINDPFGSAPSVQHHPV